MSKSQIEKLDKKIAELKKQRTAALKKVVKKDGFSRKLIRADKNEEWVLKDGKKQFPVRFNPKLYLESTEDYYLMKNQLKNRTYTVKHEYAIPLDDENREKEESTGINMSNNDIIAMTLMATFYSEYKRQLKQTPQGFRCIGKIFFQNDNDEQTARTIRTSAGLSSFNDFTFQNFKHILNKELTKNHSGFHPAFWGFAFIFAVHSTKGGCNKTCHSKSNRIVIINIQLLFFKTQCHKTIIVSLTVLFHI